jgi:hypothetical protein
MLTRLYNQQDNSLHAATVLSLKCYILLLSDKSHRYPLPSRCTKSVYAFVTLPRAFCPLHTIHYIHYIHFNCKVTNACKAYSFWRRSFCFVPKNFSISWQQIYYRLCSMPMLRSSIIIRPHLVPHREHGMPLLLYFKSSSFFDFRSYPTENMARPYYKVQSH